MQNTKWIFITLSVAAVWLLSAAETGFIGQWGLWTSLGISAVLGAAVLFSAEQSKLKEANKNIARKYRACKTLCVELKKANSEQAMRIRTMEQDIKDALCRIERTSDEIDRLRNKNVELSIRLQKQAGKVL